MNVWSTKAPVASVPRMVNVKVPGVVGVPESRPAGVRVRPGGSAPAVTLKLNGAVPPLPVSVWLKGTPPAPFGNVAGDIVITAAAVLHPPMVSPPARVTEPFAVVKARPVTLTPEPRAMMPSETTVPGKMRPLRVAWVGTRQKTLQGSTPLRITLALTVRELASVKT